MKKQLFCGASKREITPGEDILPYMMGLGKAVFGMIQDKLYVRVIAFSNGEDQSLLVSFDLDKAGSGIKYIVDEYNLLVAE